jgi:hypothetical protein
MKKDKEVLQKIECRHHSRDYVWKTNSDGKKGVYCRLCKKFIYK